MTSVVIGRTKILIVAAWAPAGLLPLTDRALTIALDGGTTSEERFKAIRTKMQGETFFRLCAQAHGENTPNRARQCRTVDTALMLTYAKAYVISRR
jgi:hypothetical protein